MTGFTLYETLRILVPGILAVLIGEVSLVVGMGWAKGQPPSWSPAALFSNPASFIGISLAVGLLLYAVDLPSRLMIARQGDDDFLLPSAQLAELLGNKTIWNSNVLGLYFLISDKYLSPETHRRVYLFGSLYRVFVDLRFLLGVGTVLGCALSIGMSPSAANIGWSLPAFVMLLSVLAVVPLLGFPAELLHKANSLRKKSESEYKKERREGVKKLILVYGLLLILGSLGVWAFSWGRYLLIAGIAGALADLTLWFWVEIGKPVSAPKDSKSASKDKRLDLRSRFLWMLKVNQRAPNFWPLQRVIADLCFFAPWLVGASIGIARQGGRPSRILLLGGLVWPCTLIMSLRKHEVRLLTTYREQSLWLRHHEEEIKRIASTGRLPEQWS